MKFMRSSFPFAILLVGVLPVHAGEKALIDTTRSAAAKMYMTDLADVHWRGGLFGDRFDVCRDTMVPHMGEIFRDKNDSHAWDNFLMAAGLGTGRDGKPHGPSFNDGDFLKWVEALSQIYAVTRDPKIDAQLDEIIAVVAKAQREDGYLHTPKIILQRQQAAAGNPKEFEDREHFETYNMGHLMTTACIHYRATGKTTLLACALKAADYIDRLCKTAPADLARNAICPSHYMGVVELYRTTREPRYLELAKQLIEIRSLVTEKDGSDHNQDRVPFREMTEAVGHAVRANYLYAGVADVFAEAGDESLLKTIATISEDVAGQKLYITGMTGALYDGASPDGTSKHPTIKTVHQAYGRDYQLPNLTAYNETCATIGYAMWMWRMLEVTGDARYTDLFEQSLYNGVLPGISLEGKDYFYVNPLRKMADFGWPMRWSRTRTPNIKSSFCCPPNVVRTIAETHNYVYALSADTLWVHLYAASDLDTKWIDGTRIRLRQETDYPWNGAVKFTIVEAPAKEIALKLRIPGWLHAGAAKIQVNGKNATTSAPAPGSYSEIRRAWKAGDVVTVDFAFKPVVIEANPLVEETLNQVSVKYGPLVYCLESNDLPAGVRLSEVALALGGKHSQAKLQSEKIANAQVLTLTLPARHLARAPWKSGELYREATAATSSQPIEIKLVPYYAWGNRGDTEMSVWLPVR
ncbi:MAG TPA: beta-L-arabinofuranosidase domain-containing protein [Opitutaceae bacterium]|nr:beta-L-arabinofuranosidase domain-containing protein [Opitutaceae bacterium]